MLQRSLRGALVALALLAGTSRAGAVDVMVLQDGTLTLSSLVTFSAAGGISLLNRAAGQQFAGNPWVLGNPDGTASGAEAQNQVRLREAMAAWLLKLTASTSTATKCNALDRDLTCVGKEVAELRKQFTNQTGVTPDVASIKGNGVSPREILIAEGKPSSTIGKASEQLQEFRRLATTGTKPYAMPASGQLIVTEHRVATSNSSEYAVGPADLNAAESVCILYHAERVTGHDGRAAKFYPVQQGDQVDTGPTLSRLGSTTDPQPRKFAIFFLRPSATPLTTTTTIAYTNRCKIQQNLGNNQYIVAYKIGTTWYYAQTGDAV